MAVAPSLVEYMNRKSPNELAALKREFPGAGDLLSTQRMMGEDDKSLPNRDATIKLIQANLDSFASDMDRLSQAIRATMKRVSSICFMGSLVATVAGGLTAILALAFTEQVVQAIAAFVAMLGGIASVTADQFERAPSGVRIASADEYAKLVGTRSDLELLRMRIARDAIIPIPDADLEDMLKKMDQYAVTVRYLEMA